MKKCKQCCRFARFVGFSALNLAQNRYLATMGKSHAVFFKKLFALLFG